MLFARNLIAVTQGAQNPSQPCVKQKHQANVSCSTTSLLTCELMENWVVFKDSSTSTAKQPSVSKTKKNYNPWWTVKKPKFISDYGSTRCCRDNSEEYNFMMGWNTGWNEINRTNILRDFWITPDRSLKIFGILVPMSFS